MKDPLNRCKLDSVQALATTNNQMSSSALGFLLLVIFFLFLFSAACLVKVGDQRSKGKSRVRLVDIMICLLKRGWQGPEEQHTQEEKEKKTLAEKSVKLKKERVVESIKLFERVEGHQTLRARGGLAQW